MQDSIDFFSIFIFVKSITVDVTNDQNWSNYIGPKRENPLACLTNAVFAPVP